jgi:hypothetical protein
MAQAEELLLPWPLILIQSTWPGRRVSRDSDLRGYRWTPDREDLEEVVLRTVAESERRWPLLDLQVTYAAPGGLQSGTTPDLVSCW